MADISGQLAELQRSMGRIEGKLDRAQADSTDQEKRLRRVEGRLHWYSGAGAILGGMVTFFGGYLKTHA